jgi:two-component system, chemotaxis family, CheB/CheR fusion protein
MSRDTTDPAFDSLLEYLKQTRGFEFTAYKSASLMRRVSKRMHAMGIDSFPDYQDYLEVHPEEFGQLFNAILINVTAFFRDETAWTYVRDEILPNVLAAGGPIRVWSAGCASGEEAYSVAMLLAELLGRSEFRDRVKVYATDVDEAALNQARAARYTERQVAAVPPALVEKYFTVDGDRYVFDKELRRSVIFGRHDLILDAPISRANVLLCRNTLMYFNTEAQNRILARFHFALTEGGVLFLGRAEMLLTQPQMFEPISLRRRLFKKVAIANWRERLAIMSQAGSDEGGAVAQSSIVTTALDASPHAQLIIDDVGILTFCNDRARTLFNVGPGDLGRPIQDLELSYRPIELRSLISQALEQRRPIALRDVAFDGAGRGPRYFDVYAAPLPDASGRTMGIAVSFTDVTKVQELQTQLTRSKQDLETAYEELQSTNEELETTNEELQSTVEELETTNEELQSTNEELETMNEELQSTNEELQTMNDELRDRSDDLNRANGFFESILTGVRSGVVVVDRDLRVIAWNHRAEDLWGLRADEVSGQNFLNLDIGLPTGELRAGIRACLSGESEYTDIVVTATNRRGRTLSCRVTGSPLVGADKEIRGVILLMDEHTKAAALEVEDREATG